MQVEIFASKIYSRQVLEDFRYTGRIFLQYNCLVLSLVYNLIQEKSYFQIDSRRECTLFYRNKWDQSRAACLSRRAYIIDTIIWLLIATWTAVEQRSITMSESDIIVIEAQLTRYRALICRTEGYWFTERARAYPYLEWQRTTMTTFIVSNARSQHQSPAPLLLRRIWWRVILTHSLSESCWKSSTVHWARPENFKCANSSTTSCFHSQLFQTTVCKSICISQITFIEIIISPLAPFSLPGI